MARDPDRRRELLDAAERAIRQHGAGATMDDMAAEAGITKPILYRHFGAKGGLYDALARRWAGLLGERLEAALAAESDWRRRVEVTLDTWLVAIETDPELYRFLVHRAAAERPEVSAAVGDFTHHFAARLADILDEEFSGAGFTLPNALLIAHAIVGAAQQAGDAWLAMGPPRPPRTVVVEELGGLLWRGLPALGQSTSAT